MMASVDAEAEMENLFAEDEAVEGGTQSLTQQEGTGLDLTNLRFQDHHQGGHGHLIQ